MPRPLVALLTDFGTKDSYVGMMKAVMKKTAPDVDFIDITHHITPQNVREGAFALMNAYKYFPARTIFLVVVDPGVGTPRRSIAVETSDYFFVAPDNGVLSYALRWETVQRAVRYEPSERGVVSHTFHGRDIFAPVAATIAREGGIHPSFKAINPNELVSLPFPSPQVETADDSVNVSGEVISIDRFGNVITSIGELRWHGENLRLMPVFDDSVNTVWLSPSATVEAGNVTIQDVNKTYGTVGAGEVLALVGSTGHLEIAVNQGSAAERLGLNVGDTIRVQSAKVEG